MRFLLLFFCVVFCGEIFAQAKEEITMISKFYRQHKNYRVVVKYKMFETATSGTQLESYSATLLQKGEDYVYAIEGIRHVKLGTTYIEIDSADHVMAVGNQKKGDATMGFQIDSMFKYFSATSIKTVPADGDGKMILLPNGSLKANGQFSKVEMYYNNKYCVTRLVFHFAKAVKMLEDSEKLSKGRLEVLYGTYENLPADAGTLFSHNTYYREKGKVLVAGSQYQTYTVYDTRFQEK